MASAVATNGALLFYGSSNGLGATGTLAADGSFVQLQAIPGFTSGFTHIAGYR